MKSFFSSLCFLIFTALSATGQTVNRDVEMADQMRAEGKIYVVVAVVLIIFMGMILYLISLDKKISKIEKEKSGI